MTRPAILFFGFDQTPDRVDPKIFMRGLLYSTAPKGLYVEGLQAILTRNESKQVFSYWGYGEVNNLQVGGGLFVDQTGISKNHHFLPPPDQSSYAFESGKYDLRIQANIVGKDKSRTIFETELLLSDDHAKKLETRNAGITFVWNPVSKTYYPEPREPKATSL